MRTLRIYSNNTPRHHTAVLAIVLVMVLYVTSLVLMYLGTVSLYRLTTFPNPSSLHPLPQRTRSLIIENLFL